VFSESIGVALRARSWWTVRHDPFSERNGLGQGRDPQGWRDAIAALD
jgi:hypothetical protein